MSKKITLSQLIKNPIAFFACGFGSGLSPIAPGTMGTLMAIPFYLLLSKLSFACYFSIVFLTALVGIWLCDVTARVFKVHDDKRIVWDEMVGYWLTMAFVPARWFWIVVGFILFRLFDIWKPWPIITIDKRVKGGLGIMLDDIVAAVYAAIVMELLKYLFFKL